jgi:hypothetical protein
MSEAKNARLKSALHLQGIAPSRGTKTSVLQTPPMSTRISSCAANLTPSSKPLNGGTSAPPEYLAAWQGKKN